MGLSPYRIIITQKLCTNVRRHSPVPLQNRALPSLGEFRNLVAQVAGLAVLHRIAELGDRLIILIISSYDP